MRVFAARLNIKNVAAASHRAGRRASIRAAQAVRQFESCAIPPGIGAVRGTREPQATAPIATVSQLLREPYYAIAANGYFDSVNSAQRAPFLTETTEFPSIEDNLLLDDVSNETMAMNGAILDMRYNTFIKRPTFTNASTA